jgi:hypothetical protein
MIMGAQTISQYGMLPEHRDRLWNSMFWLTITAFEMLGWFLSHQS